MLVKLIESCEVGGESYAVGAVLRSPGRITDDDANLLLANKQAVECGVDPHRRKQLETATPTPTPTPKRSSRPSGQYKIAKADPGPIWVVIPTFDRSLHLGQCLKSLVAQDLEPAGIVVINDGPEGLDEVTKIVKKACSTITTKVIVEGLPEHTGAPNVPRTTGMAHVPDEAMVVELDDHDLLCPGALRLMRNAMRAGNSFVYGGAMMFAAADHLHPNFQPEDWFVEEDQASVGEGLAFRRFDKPLYRSGSILSDGCYVCGVRAYRKSLYDYVGGWREKEIPAGDCAMFLRFEMATEGRQIVALEQRLAWCRRTQSSMSTKMAAKQGTNTYRYQLRARKGLLLDDDNALEDTFSDLAGTFTKRFGIWLANSGSYSGGRIHMYQDAITWAADLGAEVFLITGGAPRWAKDYAATERIHLIISGVDPIPEDIDVAITDSKVGFGQKAQEWAEARGRPFACVNFETPNWVHEFLPDYAVALGGQEKENFADADALIANSRESGRYLQKWLETDKPVYVNAPKVNTYALEMSKTADVELPTRPFALWSARPSKYKGGDIAMKAIWALDVPFDIVTFGHPNCKLPETALHKLYTYPNRPDVEKYALLRAAHMALAPSKFEGFGMVPMEALCSGTPALVYDLPVMREEYGDVLEYVAWGDEDAFTEKVREYATRPKKVIDPAPHVAKFGHATMRAELEAIPFLGVRERHVSAHMIAYWGFVPQSLESIYPHVDEIKIAFGRVRLAPEIDDGSLDRLRAFPDPDNKITLEVRDVWPNKKAMRAWGTSKLQGNYHLLLDGDEIWTGLEEWIAAGLPQGSPRWVNLWHGGKYWVHDGPGESLHWGYPLEGGASLCPHYRWSYWRNSFMWLRHCIPGSATGRPVMEVTPDAALAVPGTTIYHLGHALPSDVLDAKYKFYAERDRANPSREKAWKEWNGKAGQTEDGVVEMVDWKLPKIVKEALK
ncbi:MAG: glycosyltransferase [Deltaproteobacteria bacterium]|nr:glycosyltransferase [Deltaproteobacteria bacterium]